MQATTRRRLGGLSESWLSTVERFSGLTRAGLGLLLAGAGGWILARLLGGRTLYLIVYAGAALLVAAHVVARRRRPLSAERTTPPSRAREGQSIQVGIMLRASRRLTSFVVREDLHPHLGATVRIPVGAISPRDEIEHAYTLRPRLRGVYAVGPLVAEWTDPFGLARGEQVLAKATEIIVHPTTEAVLDRPLARQWEDPPVRPPVTKPWPAGFEFYGMRDYVPGDDLRRVVWRAVARTGKMLVREYEQGITDRVVVLLDTDGSWHRPGDPSDTFESAVRTAASIGARHIKEGFSVTLETNGRQLAKLLRGPRSRIAYLDALARVNRSKDTLDEGIERLLGTGAKGAHFVVVTPHLDPRGAARLRLLMDRGGSVLVAAVMWEESDPQTLHHAAEIGAQVVELKPGAALATGFDNAMRVNVR
jgi:uncharacterized protein (DUF58 family)